MGTRNKVAFYSRLWVLLATCEGWGLLSPFWGHGGHGVVLALFCSEYAFFKIKNAHLLNSVNLDKIRYGCYTYGKLTKWLPVPSVDPSSSLGLLTKIVF